MERIGLPKLEKWTDLSLFDTDILSVKARQAGFTLACCRDLFVHHFGTRTFSHNTVRLRASHSHLVTCVCSNPSSQKGCDYDAARKLLGSVPR